MTHIRRIFPAFLILAACVTWGHAPAAARGAPESFADLAERLLPSVVNISSTQVQKKSTEKGGPEVPRFPEGSPFQDFLRNSLIASSGKRPRGVRRPLAPVSSSIPAGLL